MGAILKKMGDSFDNTWLSQIAEIIENNFLLTPFLAIMKTVMGVSILLIGLYIFWLTF